MPYELDFAGGESAGKRTRERKKRTSDFEDEDYVAEEEATSKRVEPAQGTKPGLKIKRPIGRQAMS